MKLTHVRLLVSDMSLSFRFYKDVLELPTTWAENPGYAEFELGPGLSLAIFPRDEMQGVVDLRPQGDGAMVILSVESVDEAAVRLRAAGAEVSDPVDRPDWGIRVAHLRDPDGNLIELYHDIEWERDA